MFNSIDSLILHEYVRLQIDFFQNYNIVKNNSSLCKCDWLIFEIVIYNQANKQE